ncbi:MAG: phospholipase D-like domain-containing protein, partial [Acidobacteriota bacterium]|nr:phospholipase D-like domain-containing protein [Acidobacteriota bacterium]
MPTKVKEDQNLGLFSGQAPSGNLTVFKAELVDCEQTAWPELFAGFTSLKAITFSSSLEFLIRFVPRFEDAEIVFGSERILSKEHLALTQASQAVESYGFGDALADQKIFTEALGQYLGKHGQGLLERVLDGSLRFRLLRKRPSHEKLYLLSGEGGQRVVTGSANLSSQAFEGRQQEIYVSFEGQYAYSVFDDYYRRDWAESAPVDADLIVQKGPGGAPPAARSAPIDLNDVPIARVLKAGIVILDEPGRSMSNEFTTASLREAEKLGTELRDLSLPKSRTGQTVIDAGALVKA